MTHTFRNGSISRLAMFAFALVMALPFAAFADPQGRGRGRGQDKKDDVFVNGHDARDGRRDGRGPRRDRDRRDRNDDGRRNRDRDGRYDNDGRYGNNGDYYGGNSQLRQTALNAGYNEGIQEGRNDRQRGERFEYRDESDYRNASKDYSSRLGDRGQYQQYFRQGFANGYRDGYNGN
jgi:hypothetical protein